jgi:hypothetical protein
LLLGRNISERSSLLDLLSGRWLLLGPDLHVLAHFPDVERALHPEGAGERSAAVRQVDARRDGVHGGASPGPATGRVGSEDTVDQDDTQQGSLRVADPAPHTGADRALDRGWCGVYS